MESWADLPEGDAMASQSQPVTLPLGSPRGFPSLPCLWCGEEGSITLDLEDLRMHCSECDTDFTAADIRERLAAWGAVVRWLDYAPVVEG